MLGLVLGSTIGVGGVLAELSEEVGMGDGDFISTVLLDLFELCLTKKKVPVKPKPIRRPKKTANDNSLIIIMF